MAKRYRFTGKERDEESGLAYHSARYYAPWLLRWTAADPAGLVDGGNLYRYAWNNPVGFSDVGGRASASSGMRDLATRIFGFSESGCAANPGGSLCQLDDKTATVEAVAATAGAAVGISVVTGGAVATATGSVLAGAAVGGGLGVGINYGANTGINGGSAEDVLTTTGAGVAIGAVGGIVGAVGGAAGGAIAAATRLGPLLSSVVSGASAGLSGDVAIQAMEVGLDIKKRFSVSRATLFAIAGGALGGMLAPAQVKSEGPVVSSGPGGTVTKGMARPSELFGRQTRGEFTSSQIKKIKNSIKAAGYDQSRPIDVAIVNGRKIIIDGHHRARAAGGAKVDQVPIRIHQVGAATASKLEQQAAEAAHSLGLSDRW